MKMVFGIFVFLSAITNAQTITTLAGNGIAGYNGDNASALSAELHNPYEVIFDTLGNMFISDYSNNSIRKINSSGIITTIAGNGVAGYSGDNSSAIGAQLFSPIGLALDKTGNLYISDAGNNRVRKINTLGIITTVAGTGISGSSGDNGPATSAQINSPNGIAFDAAGNLYISEELGHRVRKVDSSGIITTFAGTGIGGYSGDNISATSSQLNVPGDITFDVLGNLYIAEQANYRIRKIDALGTITTYAGTGIAGYSGNNGLATLAKLNIPYGIKCSVTGDVFFSDAYNNVIRKIDFTGIITTIVGNGFGGGANCSGAFSGDNGPALSSELNNPTGITFDNTGNLYIADLCNNRIRKVTNITVGVDEINPKEIKINLFPNPANNTLKIVSSSQWATCSLYDVLGSVVLQQELKNREENIDVSNLPNGVYFVSVRSPQGATVKKIVVQH